MTRFASRSSAAVSAARDRDDLARPGRPRAAAAPPLGAEAAGDHARGSAVHRAAHDVAEDRAGGADERAGDDQQVVGEHEAGGRRGPAGVAVEHRDDDRHVGAADREDQVHAEEPARATVIAPSGASPASTRPGADEDASRARSRATSSARLSSGAPGSSSGLPPIRPLSLPNATTEPVKVTAPIEDAEVDLDQVDRPLGAGEVRRRGRGSGEADEHRREADEAVQDRDQLRHLGHLDPRARAARRRPRRPAARRPASRRAERAARALQAAYASAEDRRADRERHADHAVDVAAPRGLLVARARRG